MNFVDYTAASMQAGVPAAAETVDLEASITAAGVEQLASNFRDVLGLHCRLLLATTTAAGDAVVTRAEFS